MWWPGLHAASANRATQGSPLAVATREAFQAVAIKEVLAWQITEAMKAQGLSRKRLAERMGTSRSQVSRLLDPKDGNVTLVTLQRAAALLGRKVSLELV